MSDIPDFMQQLFGTLKDKPTGLTDSQKAGLELLKLVEKFKTKNNDQRRDKSDC